MDKTIEQLIEDRDKLHDELVNVELSNLSNFLEIAHRLRHVYRQIEKLGYSRYIKKENLI